MSSLNGQILFYADTCHTYQGASNNRSFNIAQYEKPPFFIDFMRQSTSKGGFFDVPQAKTILFVIIIYE
jgi:hypothetical protein